ncbi:MAG: autotransporter-associated beta strand repeat-containing protein [Kiritimatiellia bacterium]
MPAHGATQTYQDGNALNTWNTTDLNWDAGVVWVDGNDATFAGTGEAVTVGTVTVHNTVFNSTGYNLSGGTITLSGSGPTITANQNAIIGSIIAGGNLTKNGTGVLTLSGSNTYSGGTELTAGTISVGALSGIGTGYLAVKFGSTFQYTGSGSETSTATLWLDNGASTFDINNASGSLTWNAGGGTRNAAFTKTGAGTLTMGGAFSGGAAVTVNGGTLVLSTSNSNTGATTLTSGTLKATNTAALGSGNVAMNGGTLQLATDTAHASRNVTVGGGSSIILDRATAGAGFSTSFGSLTFNDTYTLSVSKGANVTSGTATLNFTGFPALGAAGKTAGFNVGSGVEVHLSGSLTGTQAFAQVAKSGAGTLILSGNNNYWDPASNTGLITVSGGTLDLRSQNAMGMAPTRPTAFALDGGWHHVAVEHRHVHGQLRQDHPHGGRGHDPRRPEHRRAGPDQSV